MSSNPATEAMNDIKEASSLPNRTKEALGPESDEDRVMYEGDENVQPKR